MQTKVIIFMSGILLLASVVSCLKVPVDEDNRKAEVIIPDKNDNFDTNTQDIKFPNAVYIEFSNGSVIVDNPLEGYGINVQVNREDVIISSTLLNTEMNYVLSGTATAGSVKIYSEYKFGLVLNGVSIQNPTGAAINIQSSKKVSVTLVGKTSNRLVDEGVFRMTDGERMNGTLYSEGQLVFDGTGNLLIYGNYSHAIGVHDFVAINNGNITVNNATKDGIHCRKYFQMEGGSLIINAQSDGVDCTNGYVMINGGEIYCNSNKNGFVAMEGPIVISGGLIVASASKSVFFCESKIFSITGGMAVGTGGETVMPNESECTQQTVVWGASGFTAGQLISIKSSNNSEVLTFKIPKRYSGNMALVFTSPFLHANTAYSIYKGGTVSGNNHFHGLYDNAVSSGGAVAATFTTSSMVTTVGNLK